MMDKKNTLLLTVIAIATLLVAVVGATFAYFTASSGASELSNVSVQTRSVDVTSTTATDVTMVVQLSDMVEGNGANDYSAYKNDTSATIKLDNSVGAAGGTRTCSYNVVYTPKADGAYVTTQAARDLGLNEFTIQATANIVGSGVSSSTTISEFNLGDIAASTSTNITATPLTFAVTGAVDGNETSSITWTFDVRYYNLAIDQTINAGKTFGGTLEFVKTGSELCTTA